MFDAKKLLDLLVQGGGQAGQPGGMLGQVGSVVGQVLQQATGGVQQAAGQIDQATGASTRASDIVSRMTGGKSPADLLAQAKTMAGQNPMATGAVLGGLAAVLLGTGAGRAVTGTAARMGGMALIGGLAYKALQNYQAGKPLLDLKDAATMLPAPAAPAGDANDRALRLVRAMVAAASSDGIVDDTERAAILGNLKAAGLDDEAAQFIDAEFANPADPDTLAEGATTPEAAAEIYTAARLAIDPDTQEEQDFLAALADRLGLEPGLVAHIDAAANSAKGA